MSSVLASGSRKRAGHLRWAVAEIRKASVRGSLVIRAPSRSSAGRLLRLVLLQRIDPLGGFGFRQIRVEGLGVVSLLGKRLEVRALRARHRFIARDPLLGFLLRVVGRRSFWICHVGVPCWSVSTLQRTGSFFVLSA